MKNQNSTTSQEAKIPKPKKPLWRRIFIGFEIAILSIIAVFVTFSFLSGVVARKQLEPLVAASNQMRDYFITAGGSEEVPQYQASYGLNIWSRCGGEQCPVAGGSWIIPITPGNNKQFIVDALKQEGWTVKQIVSDCETLATGRWCGATATKGSLEINIYMDVHAGSSTQNVAPKIWRSTGFRITTR